MNSKAIIDFIVNNSPYLLGIVTVVLSLMFLMVLNLTYKLSRMQKRYKKMMTGVDDSANLESMLLSHIDETRAVADANEKLRKENQRISELLDTAITRVGVVRFCAFENMGSDLSYAVALLDAHNNGVVMSSLFGREDSRSYVKPIENGTSTYTLTAEEQQALRKAMDSAK